MLALSFDPTVTLGTVLSMLGIVAAIAGAAWRVSSKVNADLVGFQQAMLAHTKLLEEHAKRIDKQDGMILDVIRSLERLMGRLEAMTTAPQLRRAIDLVIEETKNKS
jgi:hypothetical protein